MGEMKLIMEGWRGFVEEGSHQQLDENAIKDAMAWVKEKVKGKTIEDAPDEFYSGLVTLAKRIPGETCDITIGGMDSAIQWAMAKDQRGTKSLLKTAPWVGIPFAAGLAATLLGLSAPVAVGISAAFGTRDLFASYLQGKKEGDSPDELKDYPA